MVEIGIHNDDDIVAGFMDAVLDRAGESVLFNSHEDL